MQKSKNTNEGCFTGLLLAIVLIGGSILALATGKINYHRGYPVPLWGEVVILCVGIIILIIVIRHRLEEKKTQTLSDAEDTDTENAEPTPPSEDAQNTLESEDKK